jgi:hypothetical protein
MTTDTREFKVWAHAANGRILSLAAEDYANSVEHVTAATASDVLAVTRAVTVGVLLNYDSEEYEETPVAYFRVMHPFGGIETIAAEVPVAGDEAFAVEFEDVVNGYWEGFVVRGLTGPAARECARIKSSLGSRNVVVVRDPENDGSATNGQWI